MEHFDDILRTFVNKTNTFENRCGKNRDEEKMVAVKKLMLASLSNLRFFGTTVSCDELLIALENIIIDRVAKVPTIRKKNITRVLRWTSEWRQQVTVKTREQKGTRKHGPRTAGCSQRNMQRKFGVLERAKIGTQRNTQLAKVAKKQIREDRTHGGRLCQ